MEKFQKVNQILGTDFKSDNDINWVDISSAYILSEDFMDEFKEDISWEHVSVYQRLSEEFIRSHENYVNWDALSARQKLSYDLIKDYKEKVNWMLLMMSHRFSEEFIEEFKDYVDWACVSKYQKLSEDFIEKHIDRINILYVYQYQKLSNCFIEKYRKRLSDFIISKNNSYKTTEQKKQDIIGKGLYECYDDYFIAYKTVRKDRYSLYNFQNKYEKGETYESWCDCSDSSYSFGLNVGTEDVAKYFMKQFETTKHPQIIRCKVKYEDVGRVSEDGKNIRCFKLEVLD